MNVHVLWFLVVTLTGVATCATSLVAQRFVVGPRGQARWQTHVWVGLLSFAALCLLGLGWRIHAIAAVDGHLVRTLSQDRRPSLASTFGVLTTLGDAIPSLVIATSLAGVLFLRTRHWVVWVLPALVIVQEAVGVVFVNVVAPLTIGTLEGPPTVIGSSGSMPSGSVARLFTIFTVAAVLWGRLSPSTRRRCLAASVVLVPLQGVTRVYLGLHLVADVVAGLLLGLTLVMLGSLVIHLAVRRWPLADASQADGFDGI